MVLQLLAQGYLSARLLRSGPCLSEWVMPCASITAGCGEANNAARISIYSIAEQASQASPCHQLSQFVDDLKQYGQAKTQPELLRIMIPAMQGLVRGMKEGNFVFSKKSTIMGSTRAIADAIQAAATVEGIHARVDTVAKDLGVDVTSQRRRRVPLQLKRLRLGLARAKAA